MTQLITPVAVPSSSRSPMPRPPKSEKDPSKAEERGQVNFRADAELWARIQEVCAGLGLDVANLARMVIHENLHIYEERVAQIRRARSAMKSANPEDSTDE